MKQTMWRLPALLLLVAMVVLTVNSMPRAWMGPPAKVGIFEPVKRPVEPGPVDVLFRFAPPEGYEGDSVFHVTATAREAGIYTGRRNWTITASPDQPHEEVLTVIVAPDTISALTLNVMGKDYHWFPSAYFIERGDSVEFWQGYPRGPQPPADRSHKADDTLEIRFSLRDTTQLRQVLEIVGELPDSSLGKTIVTTTTWRQLLQISNLGIDAKNWGIPSRGGNKTPDNRDSSDSSIRIPPKPDLNTLRDTSRHGQLNSTDKNRYSMIWIDTVVGGMPPGMPQPSNPAES
jgi:hypothetical protein